MKKALYGILLWTSLACAHPGHGAPELHMHAEWWLAAIAAAVGLLWWAWKR